MKRRDLALAALGALLLALGGCNPFPATCRMRLTLVLDTPLGPRTGSSVIQVTAREIIHFAGSNRFERDDRGQAVIIRVGDDVVFAVLEEGIGRTLIRASRSEDPTSENLLADIRRVSAKASDEPTYDLPKGDWPSLVRFADRNVPESILPVCMNLRPEEQDRGDSHGPCSIRIARATVVPTKDAVTTGMLDYLPWLTTRHGSMKRGMSEAFMRPEQRLSDQNFLRNYR